MRAWWALASLLTLSACTESTEDPSAPGYDAGADTARVDAGSSDAGSSDKDGALGDSSALDARPVINEIRSEDKTLPEYVELYNPTSKELDLTGWGVGGQKSDGTDDAPYVFPAGTKIASGGYLVLSTNMKDDAGCKALDVKPCLFTDAGISGSRGETMRLVDASGALVEKASIPATDAETGPTLLEPQSWGRLPNGTGEFAVNKPSPGKANAAP